MNDTDIIKAIEHNSYVLRWMRRDANSSATLCDEQSLNCLAHHKDHTPFPTFTNETSRLPLNWVQSAMGWMIRAGQHQFGFNTPSEWIRLEDIMEASVRERITDAASLS